MKAPEEIHAILQTAFDSLHALRFVPFPDLSMDTFLALRMAIGQIDKAKGLVGRDIDDARRRQRDD